MLNCEYFNKVVCKHWCIVEALKKYEEDCQVIELNELCARIEADLSEVEKKRKFSKTLAADIQAFKAKLNMLRTLKCLYSTHPIMNDNKRQEQPPSMTSSSTEQPAPMTQKAVNNAININNNGGKYTNKIQQVIKKRRIRESEDESEGEEGNESEGNVYLNSPSARDARTNTRDYQPSQHLEPLEEVRRATHLSTNLVLTHGQKQYTIRTPSQAPKHSPHRPKITNSHLEALKEYFVFATTFATTGDATMLAEYQVQQERQRRNSTLVDLGVFDFINDMLKKVPHDGFPETLWSRQCSESSEATKVFMKIVKYVLTGFHLLCHSSVYPISDHERSFFIEYVIPGLMAISKTSESFDFFWCEYELQAIKEVDMFYKDFNMMKAQRRYIDALGKMTAGSEMEIVIVEASSGPLSENVTHSIEDTLKAFECATASLSTIASKYRHASINTFKKMQILSLQVIKNKMTLSTTSLNDAYTWKRMDLRVAEIPTQWSDRINMLRYFELLATLMERIQICIEVEDDLKNENVGSEPFDGKTIEEALDL